MVEAKIKALRDELEQHNYNYYVLSTPTISDREFDEKMKELQALEEAHPEFADPHSPTQRVGSDLSKEFEQVVHSIRCFLWEIPIPKKKYVISMSGRNVL